MSRPLTAEQRQRAEAMLADGMTVPAVTRELGVSRALVMRVKEDIGPAAKLRALVLAGKAKGASAPRAFSEEEKRAYEAQLLARDRKPAAPPAAPPAPPAKPARDPEPLSAEERAELHRRQSCDPCGSTYHPSHECAPVAPEPIPAPVEAPEVPMTTQTEKTIAYELQEIEKQRAEIRAKALAYAQALEDEASEIRKLLGEEPATQPAARKEPQQRKRGDGRKRIIEAISYLPTARADILAALPDMDDPTVSSAINAMIRQGLVERVGRATYRRIA